MEIIIPKNKTFFTISLDLNVEWNRDAINKNEDRWYSTLKSCASVISGRTNVDIPLNRVSIERGYGPTDAGHVVLVITNIYPRYDDRFKDTTKDFMQLVMPSLKCVSGSFIFTSGNVYTY